MRLALVCPQNQREFWQSRVRKTYFETSGKEKTNIALLGMYNFREIFLINVLCRIGSYPGV